MPNRAVGGALLDAVAARRHGGGERVPPAGRVRVRGRAQVRLVGVGARLLAYTVDAVAAALRRHRRAAHRLRVVEVAVSHVLDRGFT